MGNRLSRERLLRKSLAVLCAASIILTGAGFGAGISAYAEVEPAIEEEENEEEMSLGSSDEAKKDGSQTEENNNDSQISTDLGTNSENQDNSESSDSSDSQENEVSTPDSSAEDEDQKTQDIEKEEKSSQSSSSSASSDVDQEEIKKELPDSTDDVIPSDNQKKDESSNPVDQVPENRKANANTANLKKVELDKEPKILEKAAADDSGTKAEGDGVVPYDPSKIIIPFTKTWDDNDNAQDTRPESLTVKLYRYTDDEAYDAHDPIKVLLLPKDGEWEGEFQLSDEENSNEAAFYINSSGDWVPYNFKVVEDEENISNYEETAHKDPEIKMETLTGEGDWVWIRPNSVETFPVYTEAYPKSFIAAKKGNQLYIWTPEKISEIEQKILLALVREHPQFPHEEWEGTHYLVGFGHHSEGGFTMTAGSPGAITFDDKSSWSFWARGTYNRSTPEQNAGSITNTLKPVEVTIRKVDADGGAALEGATLQILDEEGKVVATWVSDGKDKTINEGLDINAEYTLRETVAPDGYTIATDTTITIDEDGKVTYSGSTTDDGVLLVEDTKTKISISKVDIADGEELEGAHIQILDSEGKIVEEWDSTKKAYVVEGLKTGEEYTLKETVAPDGYTIATETTFSIDESGKVTSTGTVTEDGVLLVEDTKTKISISKVDIADGAELKGATLQIIDSEGKVKESWTSTEKAHEIEGLKTGEEYTLRETVAPDGYTLVTDTTFSISEDGEVEYSGSMTEDGVLLVEDTKTEIRVSKVDAADGKELEGAHIQILDSDEKVVEEWDSTTKPHIIEGLKTGEEYTLKETVAPEGYKIAAETTFTIDETGKVTSTGTVSEDGVLLVEDELIKLIDVTVKKVWDDDNDKAGRRPKKLKVTLSDGTVVTLNEKNQWTATVEDLPECDEKGEVIEYSWTEEEVSGYILTSKETTKDNVTTLTNKYETETTERTVKKVWDDKDDKDKLRPAKLTVRLMSGDKIIGKYELTEAEKWTKTVKDLPKYEKGKEIEYTWEEDCPKEYKMSSEKEGAITTLTNTHEPQKPPTPPYKPSDPPTPPVVPEEKMNIPVVKLWSDNNNAAGKRPANITVLLAADGVLTGDKLVLSDANEWKGVFADLPKWKAGNRIQYTVLEDLVPGYVPAVLGDKDTGFTLVNRLATVPSAVNATGDDSHMRVYGMISAVSLFAIVGYLFFWKRRKKA